MAQRRSTPLLDPISTDVGPSRLDNLGDVVQIAPYLTHVIRHHGQITLIPPENSSRIRKAKKKRPELQTRQSYTQGLSQSQEEQTHTLRPESRHSAAGDLEHPRPSSSQRGNRRRSSRARKYGHDLTIPDFPPPSFEEAVLASSSNSVRPLSTESQRAQVLEGGPFTSTASNRASTPERISRSDVGTPSRCVSEWEEDRLAGLTLEERVRRELDRKTQIEATGESSPARTPKAGSPGLPQFASRDESMVDTHKASSSHDNTNAADISEKSKGKRREEAPPSVRSAPSTTLPSFQHRIRDAVVVPTSRHSSAKDISSGWVMVPDPSTVQIPRRDSSLFPSYAHTKQTCKTPSLSRRSSSTSIATTRYDPQDNEASTNQVAPPSKPRRSSHSPPPSLGNRIPEQQLQSSQYRSGPSYTNVRDHITRYESLLNRPVPEPPVRKAQSRRPPPIPPGLSTSESHLGGLMTRQSFGDEQLFTPSLDTGSETRAHAHSADMSEGDSEMEEREAPASNASHSIIVENEEQPCLNNRSHEPNSSPIDESEITRHSQIDSLPCRSDQSPRRPAGQTEAQHLPIDETNASSEGNLNSTLNSEEIILRPLQPMFTGPTDLDLLLARLEDPDSTFGGRSYDDLLLLEEIIGPATSLEESSRRQELFDEIPCGRVEVLRRRVTKDGRKKLKLALLGVVVDKCGICLSQFKEGAEAGLLPCQHVYHGACLSDWLRRSESCPMCRQPIASTSQ